MTNDSQMIQPTAAANVNSGVAIGCSVCSFLEACGGVYTGYDCFEHCCGKPKTCHIACPRSSNFIDLFTDAGGWHKGNAEIRQIKTTLPLYLPLIQHGSSRVALIEESVIALPISLVTSFLRQFPSLTARQLRSSLKLASNCRIIVVGVAKDPFLESFWRDMNADKLPLKMAQLQIEQITAPNFSSAMDFPRTESLTNRSRIARACEQLTEAGLSVVPHLNASHIVDWQYWKEVLRENTTVSLVCKEFQTGLKSASKVQWHVEQFLDLEQELGRELHLIAIGGYAAMQHLAPIRNLTIIDSTPFMKAVKRQIWSDKLHEYISSTTAPTEPVDEHLKQNIFAHREATARRRIQSQQLPLISFIPVQEIVPARASPRPEHPGLFPDMYFDKVA